MPVQIKTGVKMVNILCSVRMLIFYWALFQNLLCREEWGWAGSSLVIGNFMVCCLCLSFQDICAPDMYSCKIHTLRLQQAPCPSSCVHLAYCKCPETSSYQLCDHGKLPPAPHLEKCSGQNLWLTQFLIKLVPFLFALHFHPHEISKRLCGVSPTTKCSWKCIFGK